MLQSDWLRYLLSIRQYRYRVLRRVMQQGRVFRKKNNAYLSFFEIILKK